MSEVPYPGKELELFATAMVWKQYLARHIKPFLGKRVLEVGAGVGGTTRVLIPFSTGEWWCLEPDRKLAGAIERLITTGELPGRCHLQHGTLADLSPDQAFDTLLYIDVLEHLKDDQEELNSAAQRLTPSGHLVVLSPAHQKLFSPFDAAIGHYRRYDRESLGSLTPQGLHLIRLIYLDSVGLLVSIGNRFLLRQAMPSPWQIALWNGILLRLSHWFDPLINYRLGKSILAVWQKAPARG